MELQVLGHQVADVLVVIDDQDMGRGVHGRPSWFFVFWA
jgi:hypothetical protein